MNATVDNQKNQLRERLAASSEGILESIAKAEGLPLFEVVECLPDSMWKAAPGSAFVDAMQDIATWGKVTTIVHTKDVIMECVGPVPPGKLGHGYYNLQGSGLGLTGHLTADNCARVVFLRRPFMKKETAAVVFFNAQGESMFKVYVGRDEAGVLLANQLERFAALEARLTAPAGMLS